MTLDIHADLRIAVRGLLHNIDLGRMCMPTDSDARALRDMKAHYLNRHVAELREALAAIDAAATALADEDNDLSN